MVKIKEVAKNSPAYDAGVRAGDELVSVNGSVINDGLDYYFHTADAVLSVELLRDGKPLHLDIKKQPYEPFGADFETYLIDKQKSCRNNCIFCFIDQNPKGMRESVYFKDDDERLSFLHGNYVTLTNLKDADIARIIHMHLSPVNVSVHTMNPELRCKIMGNRFAGEVLRYLRELSAHGIAINAQLVLCEGINDGEELQYSMEKLYELDSLQSVSAVPVGITAHREGLYPLKPYTKEGAAAVIETMTRFARRCVEERGVRMFYPSDEFYLTAGMPIPEEDEYDGYPQLENGVGMLRSHREEFVSELDYARDVLTKKDFSGREVAVATGMLAAAHIKELTAMAEDCFTGLKCHVYPVENSFFGKTVTVSGLVTGGDLIKALKDKPLGGGVLIPRNMLRHQGDLFLDGVSLEEAETALGVPLLVVEADGAEFFRRLLGVKEEDYDI